MHGFDKKKKVKKCCLAELRNGLSLLCTVYDV